MDASTTVNSEKNPQSRFYGMQPAKNACSLVCGY